MEQIASNFDFLHALCKSKDSEKLLKNATQSEREALIACLSVRKVVYGKPLDTVERKIIQRGLRAKNFFRFFNKYKRIIKPIIMCVLIKLVQEAVYYVCDA